MPRCLRLSLCLALGPAGTSAAPGDNAVVHWSGVAANAIVVGRAPAASSVLGGMVHGAMYDAVASIKGGLRAVRDRCDSAARCVGGCRRRAGGEGRPRRPRAGTDGGRPDRRTTRTWRRFRTGRQRTEAKRWAPPPRPECSRCGPATTSTTSFRTSSLRSDRACSSRSRPTPVVTPGLGLVRPFTHDSISEYRPRRPDRDDEPALRRGPGRGAVDRPRQQHRSDAVPDRDRPLPHASRRSSSSTALCVTW